MKHQDAATADDRVDSQAGVAGSADATGAKMKERGFTPFYGM